MINCLIGIVLMFIGVLMALHPIQLETITNVNILVCVAGMCVLSSGIYILYEYLMYGDKRK